MIIKRHIKFIGIYLTIFMHIYKLLVVWNFEYWILDNIQVMIGGFWLLNIYIIFFRFLKDIYKTFFHLLHFDDSYQTFFQNLYQVQKHILSSINLYTR